MVYNVVYNVETFASSVILTTATTLPPHSLTICVLGMSTMSMPCLLFNAQEALTQTPIREETLHVYLIHL